MVYRKVPTTRPTPPRNRCCSRITTTRCATAISGSGGWRIRSGGVGRACFSLPTPACGRIFRSFLRCWRLVLRLSYTGRDSRFSKGPRSSRRSTYMTFRLNQFSKASGIRPKPLNP